MLSISVRDGARARFRPLVSVALPFLLSACAASSDEAVVFGLAGPLTTSYGSSMVQGAELARAEINASGGIGGRALEFLPVDDQANPTVAPRVAQELLDDPRVVAVVGHVNSGTMAAAAATYSRGLAAVATSATSPAISALGPWIFRVASSDSANAVALARRAREADATTAILYANDDYGRGLAASFRNALEEIGGRVVHQDPYLESTEDFTPYLLRLQRDGVTLVFVAGLEEGAARIIRQAREIGLDARFLGGDGLEGLKSMGDIFDGTLVGLLYHPESSQAARGFAQRFREAYDREPDSFAALGYDATHLLAKAASRGASRAAIRRYLEAVGRGGDVPAHQGATGTVRFDANGDPQEKGFAVGVIREGQIVHTGES